MRRSSIDHRPPARPALTLISSVAIALLAGCSSAVDSTQGGSAGKGPLTFAVALDAQPNNVLQNLGRNNPWVGNVFQPLLAKDPRTGALTGTLATKWSFAPDGHSVDITLRGGVKWQNGDPFTAEDVKYTFDTIGAPGAQTNQKYVTFTSLKATGPAQLHGTFAQPSQPQALDAFLRVPIVHKGTFSTSDNGSTIVGTGPYRFTGWQPGSGYTLQRFDGYWGPKPKLKSIKFIATPDATAELNALKSGRAQLGWGLSIRDSKTLTSSDQWVPFNDGGTIFDLSVNVHKPPFTDPRARQALAYAIDYDRINQQVFAGKGTIANVFWDPKTPGLDSGLVNHFSYQPAKAKQLIQAAGVRNAAFPIAVGPNPTLKAVYQIIANDLTAVGLKPTIKSYDNSGFQAGLAKGDLGPAFLHFTGQAGLSPQTMLASIPQLRKGNAEGFFPAEYVRLRQNLLQADTEQARAAALNALTVYLQQNAPTFVMIQAPDVLVAKKSISGLATDASGHMLLGGVSGS